MNLQWSYKLITFATFDMLQKSRKITFEIRLKRKAPKILMIPKLLRDSI